MKKLCALALILALLLPSFASAISVIDYVEIYRQRINDYNELLSSSSPVNPSVLAEYSYAFSVDGTVKANFSGGSIEFDQNTLQVQKVTATLPIEDSSRVDEKSCIISAALSAAEKTSYDDLMYKAMFISGAEKIPNAAYWGFEQLYSLMKDFQSNPTTYSKGYEIVFFRGDHSYWAAKYQTNEFTGKQEMRINIYFRERNPE